jgi:hypothetical protein
MLSRTKNGGNNQIALHYRAICGERNSARFPNRACHRPLGAKRKARPANVSGSQPFPRNAKNGPNDDAERRVKAAEEARRKIEEEKRAAEQARAVAELLFAPRSAS